MAEKIAFDVVNNSLYGDLYRKGDKDNASKYRMGNLKLDSAPTVWQAFNLTRNCRETIDIQNLDDMYKISKQDLSEQEKKDLERLLQLPRE